MNTIAEIGNGDVLLWMFEFFMFVIWFWILITIFGDIFRSDDLSGGVKAVWVIVVIIAPFLGILIYLIARGSGMAGRAQKQAQKFQDAYDAQVNAAAATMVTGGSGGGGSAADQISQAKALLDAGAIDQGEFDKLKAKALG